MKSTSWQLTLLLLLLSVFCINNAGAYGVFDPAIKNAPPNGIEINLTPLIPSIRYERTVTDVLSVFVGSSSITLVDNEYYMVNGGMNVYFTVLLPMYLQFESPYIHDTEYDMIMPGGAFGFYYSTDNTIYVRLGAGYGVPIILEDNNEGASPIMDNVCGAVGYSLSRIVKLQLNVGFRF